MNSHKIVLVIGNGFDIDLGLDTRYKNFLDSEYFKKHVTGSPYKPNDYRNVLLDVLKDDLNLFDYLSYQGFKIDNWIDVEQELAKLARDSKINRIASKKEEETFELLHKQLCSYLKSIDYSNINNSTSLQLLRVLCKCANVEIISYNYTDLHKLESHLQCKLNMPIDHVHGKIEDESIILGFEDDIDINNSYAFMIKSFSPHYKSHNVRQKLLEANEVIFFGHSLGSTDYHYFQDLFRRQSNPDSADKKQIIRIFTYDENSRRDILIRLREMNNKRTDYIFDLCDFSLYRTKDDKDKIDLYLEDLSSRGGYIPRKTVRVRLSSF